MKTIDEQKKCKYFQSCINCKYLKLGDIGEGLCTHQTQLKRNLNMLCDTGGTYINNTHKKDMIKRWFCK